jgi:hypothetical protein
METALTLTRSHDLYFTRWCDLFDLNSWGGEGWMLLDLPGAPCDVTQPQMRTMTQRLRKAQECAAAGGKYGLVQAVLLSLDSQPYSPAQWLRQCVALEACSKVLLPAAHEAQVDLGAARAAYQQLTPAEQRLWRQLQQARIQTKRSCNTTVVGRLEGTQLGIKQLCAVCILIAVLPSIRESGGSVLHPCVSLPQIALPLNAAGLRCRSPLQMISTQQQMTERLSPDNLVANDVEAFPRPPPPPPTVHMLCLQAGRCGDVPATPQPRGQRAGGRDPGRQPACHETMRRLLFG